MKLRVSFFSSAALLSVVLACSPTNAQQPRGVTEALRDLCSQPANHSAFTFDKNMLQGASALFGEQNEAGKRVVAELNTITVENYRYHEPAFYVPEQMSALRKAYERDSWEHLVDQNASPKASASPPKPLTDLWMHFNGMEIDQVTVLVRGVREMNVIEVTGLLKPLDLVHLSGHFGIPKIDPGAVMVPAAPGK